MASGRYLCSLQNRVVRRVSHLGTGCAPCASHGSVIHVRTLRRHQRFSGAATLPGRLQVIGGRLIQMGGRHDSVVASNEETDSTGCSVRKNFPCRSCRYNRGLINSPLTRGQLMGDPFLLRHSAPDPAAIHRHHFATVFRLIPHASQEHSGSLDHVVSLNTLPLSFGHIHEVPV